MVYLDRKINTTPIYRTFPTFVRRNCNLKRQSFRVHKMEQERLITFYLEALFLSLRPSQVFHLEKCRFDEKFVKWHMHREMNIILLRKKSLSISCYTCFVCHFHQSITKVFEKNRLMIFRILMGLLRKYIRRRIPPYVFEWMAKMNATFVWNWVRRYLLLLPFATGNVL